MKQRSTLPMVLLALSSLGACSKSKEQCHSAALAYGELNDAYQTMVTAAQHGERGAFQTAQGQFAAAIHELADVEVTGDTTADTVLRTDIEETVRMSAAIESECEAALALAEKGADAVAVGEALPTRASFQAALDVGRAMQCK